MKSSPKMPLHAGHFAAVVGGACAGSEAAHQLASRGIYVAVFEQQALPYGKIEDGLPKWHVKLRDKEEQKIANKLSHPNIFYVPNTRLGEKIQFDDLVHKWGFSTVLLASGAWRDRPLPVEGIERYINRGFCYQNPLVEWFNHAHEPDYRGRRYDIHDNAIVIGGGLASIDVVKIIMLELTRAALQKKGIETDVIALEHGGIPKSLAEYNIRFEELGIKGCTLYYRRRDIDMPLSTIPEGADAQRVLKAGTVRQKILQNARSKYLFDFQQLSMPTEMLLDGDRLTGLRFLKTEIRDGRAVAVPGSSFDVHSPQIISSIGSIPQPIPGIPTSGELFEIEELLTGKLRHHQHVFALGNAVTGRGNIRESEIHARTVAQHVMDHFLQWREEDFSATTAETRENPALVEKHGMLAKEKVSQLVSRLETLQQQAGYNNNLGEWIEKHRPVRLEEMRTTA